MKNINLFSTYAFPKLTLAVFALLIFIFSSQTPSFARAAAGDIELPDGTADPCYDGPCAPTPGGGGGGGGPICGNGILETSSWAGGPGEECERPNQMDTNGYCSPEKNMWCKYNCKCQLLDEVVDKTLDPASGYSNQIERAIDLYKAAWGDFVTVTDHGSFAVVKFGVNAYCYGATNDPDLYCDTQYSTDPVYKRTWMRSKLMKYLKRYAPICGDDPYQTCMAPDFPLIQTASALVPNDAEFQNQWNMCRIGAPYAWDITPGNQSVTIAHIDTGVNLNHEDLAALQTSGRIVGGYTQYGLDPAFPPPYYYYRTLEGIYDSYHQHGTHTLGVMGAQFNNALGISGVIPDNVKFYIANISCKYCDRINPTFPALPNSTMSSFILSAIDRTVSPSVGAKIIYLGFNISNLPTTSLNMITSRLQNSVLVVPAGNNGAKKDKPAFFSHPQVVIVGGTDQTDKRFVNSNYGSNWVHLGAPGTAVLTANDLTYEGSNSIYPLNNIEEGTSIAAAHAVGTLGLMYSVSDSLTAPDAKTFLLSYTDPFPADVQCPSDDPVGCMGTGRLDARCATLKAQNPGMTSCPPYQNPNINFTADPTAGVAPQNVDFACSIDNALPCAQRQYKVNFGDGAPTVDSGLIPNDTFLTDHTYCDPPWACGCTPEERTFNAMCHVDNDILSNDNVWDSSQTLYIEQAPGQIAVTPNNTISLTNFRGCPNHPTIPFAISNSVVKGKEITYSVSTSSGTNWLSLTTPPSGKAIHNTCPVGNSVDQENVVFTATSARDTLPAGTSSTNITFTGPNNSIVVPVQISDPAPGFLDIAPASFPTQNLMMSNPTYPSFTFQARNSVNQGKEITYTVSSDANWLTLPNPASGGPLYTGTLFQGCPVNTYDVENVTLTINSNAYNLTPGLHSANVTFASPNNSVTKQIQIQVYPNMQMSQGQSFRRKGVTITFTNASGAPVNMGQPLNSDTCIMFRKKGKVHSGGVYEAVTCGTDGNYSTCGDMKMTGPIYLDPVNPIDQDFLNSPQASWKTWYYTQSYHTNPKWISQSAVKAYVPDVRFNTSGTDSDITRYDFDVTTECQAFNSGPINSMGTYQVSRDPMQTLNGQLANLIDVNKVYVGQQYTGFPTNPPYMSPIYQSLPNPDDHVFPSNSAYTTFVKTDPGVEEIADYAAYRRSWATWPGVPSGYKSTRYPPYSFNPVGDIPAVFEVFTGLHWSAGPNISPDTYDPTPDYNKGCSVGICEDAWTHGTQPIPYNCQSGMYSTCRVNANPYVGGYTAGTGTPNLQFFCPASGQQGACNALDQNSSVYADVYVFHDVLGYSSFTHHSQNCNGDYDQVRIKDSDHAWDPNSNIMCGP